MMPWWALAILVFGVNFSFWGTVGLTRLIGQLTVSRRGSRKSAAHAGNVIVLRHDPGGRRSRQINLTVDDVAVLIPAHNEAAVIEDSIRAITKLVPRKNIHVVSDGSTDDTFEVALRCGVKAIKTRLNVGKAGALSESIERFRLADRFPVVMLLDADTRVQPGYFAAALPLFDSPDVAAVAGCVRTDAHRMLSPVGNLLTGHRMRIYAVGQRVLKFGQTSRYLNATPIVPGFASLYRTAVLPRIDINPAGLAIEDFNMTFEVYQKKLGKVGFTLGAVAVTQDPDNLHDYIRQTRRWALGLWQTVRRHPPRLNLFTAMLALTLTELVTSSLLFVTLPVIVLVLAVPDLVSSAAHWPGFGPVYAVLSAHVTLTRIFYGVIVPDLAMTCLVAAVERRPRLLLAGVFFPFMRVLDSAIGLWAIPLAWLANSNGVWKSPARQGALGPGKHREIGAPPVAALAGPEVLGAAHALEPVASEVAASFPEAERHHASS
jgi:cellulose synthase/poly-beta-1,6-N-acetylglucosamine synthase-like glycosyltransferase